MPNLLDLTSIFYGPSYLIVGEGFRISGIIVSRKSKNKEKYRRGIIKNLVGLNQNLGDILKRCDDEEWKEY